MAISLLGSTTCSVLDSVRTKLRSILAIACSDRTDRAMHPSQVAGGIHPPSRGGQQQAWSDHLEVVLHAEEGASRRVLGWAGEKVARVGDQSTSTLEQNKQVWMDHSNRMIHGRSRIDTGAIPERAGGVSQNPYLVSSLTRWPSSGRINFSIANRTAFSEPGVENSTRPLMMPAVARLIMAGEPISW